MRPESSSALVFFRSGGTGLHGNGEVSDVLSRLEPHSSTSVLWREKNAAFSFLFFLSFL